MIQWVGWCADLDNGRCYPIESTYARRDDVEKNAARCIEDATGYPAGTLECHVYTLSQADKRNVCEEMELWARDHDDPTIPYTERNEGFRVMPTVTVVPRERTAAQDVRRAARGNGMKVSMADRLMTAYMAAYKPEPNEMQDVAARVAALIERMAA